MQVRECVGLLGHQVRTQHVCKEMVVAIPAASVIKRDDKEVRSVERLERALAAVVISGESRDEAGDVRSALH